ncbi:hypothetical protein EYF80_020360 [Liparis tanakae]|uniref:Uncharacterized protein n=1 Tax=Liparis tanakae TaxID=230148 RepID=A0A4Z2HU70_9TELE|nr:hypothetical protein EYF80_020360 [Liparis tanakae]
MVMASSNRSWSYWRYLPRFFLGCLSLSRTPPSSESSREDPRGPRRCGDWLALPGQPCGKKGGLSLKRDEGLAVAIEEPTKPSIDETRCGACRGLESIPELGKRVGECLLKTAGLIEAPPISARSAHAATFCRTRRASPPNIDDITLYDVTSSLESLLPGAS